MEKPVLTSKLTVHVKRPCPSEVSTIARASEAPFDARARRRFCSSNASHARRWPRVIGGLFGFGLGDIFAVPRFAFLRLFFGLVAVRKDFHRFNLLAILN